MKKIVFVITATFILLASGAKASTKMNTTKIIGTVVSVISTEAEKKVVIKDSQKKDSSGKPLLHRLIAETMTMDGDSAEYLNAVETKLSKKNEPTELVEANVNSDNQILSFKPVKK
jgi:hypothetical protein